MRLLAVLFVAVIFVGCESEKPKETPKDPVKKITPTQDKGMSAVAPPA